MDDGETRLEEFLKAEAKRGDLCNLTDASGSPIVPWLCQPHQEQEMPHLFKCHPALIPVTQL